MAVAAVILAAGEAKRLEGRKLLLPFGDATIIETVVGNVADCDIDETIVVLGHRAAEIAPLLEKFPVRTVLNERYREGMSASIINGIKAVSPETEAVMLVPADLPALRISAYLLVLDAYKKGKKGIVLPVHKDRRGHPVLFSMKYREELLALHGDSGAREIVARHAEDVLEVQVDSAGIYADVDTEADYRALRRPGARR